eukprot:2456578-Pleurochrysis_carterae.AAC.1
MERGAPLCSPGAADGVAKATRALAASKVSSEPRRESRQNRVDFLFRTVSREFPEPYREVFAVVFSLVFSRFVVTASGGERQ